MAKVLSHPFRFNPGAPNSFATVDDDSDRYKADQIQAFMRTHRGERPVLQDFGVDDPTFGSGVTVPSFDDTTFASEFATFYDNIILTNVTVIGREGALSEIQIEFE